MRAGTRRALIVAAVIAALIAVIVAMRILDGPGVEHATTDPSGPTETPSIAAPEPTPDSEARGSGSTPAASPTRSPTPTATGRAGQVDQPDPDAQATVIAFVDAWLHPGSPRQRAQALAPVATDALADALTGTDPAHLLQGPPTETEPIEAGPFSERHQVSLADGTVAEVVVVADGSGGWLVSTVTPVEPAG